MTRLKKAWFFFLLFFFHFVTAQNETPLIDYLSKVEANFSYNFSFKNIDLASHYVKQQPLASIEEILLFLKENTLFSYTTLQDRTIAVQKRQGLVDICGIVLTEDGSVPMPNVTITTPYQQISTVEDGSFTLQTGKSTDNILAKSTGFATITYSASELVARPCSKLLLPPKF